MREDSPLHRVLTSPCYAAVPGEPTPALRGFLSGSSSSALTRSNSAKTVPIQALVRPRSANEPSDAKADSALWLLIHAVATCDSKTGTAMVRALPLASRP